MPLDQWFSKWGPWASSVNMIRELVRKADSQVAPTSIGSQALQGILVQSQVWEPLGWTLSYLRVGVLLLSPPVPRTMPGLQQTPVDIYRADAGWMNEHEAVRLCLNLSLYVLHTVPASAGVRVLPRTVPGAAGMPSDGKWDLLWRSVPHTGCSTSVGKVSPWVAWVWEFPPHFCARSSCPPPQRMEHPPMGADLPCAKRPPSPKLPSWVQPGSAQG